MNAGGKKIDETIPVTATDHLYQHCTCKRSLRTETKLSFHVFRIIDSGERAYPPTIRLSFPSDSKISAKLFSAPHWPRLRLGQYVGSPIFSRPREIRSIYHHSKNCAVSLLACHWSGNPRPFDVPWCDIWSESVPYLKVWSGHAWLYPALHVLAGPDHQENGTDPDNESIGRGFPDPLHARTRLSFLPCNIFSFVRKCPCVPVQLNIYSLNTSCWILFN